MASQPTEAAVIEALHGVIDPARHQDLVTLRVVKGIHVRDANVSVLLTVPPSPPLREKIEKDVRQALAKIPGVASIGVNF